MQGVLNGREHTALGAVAVERVTPDVALALSRGRYQKPYDYVDPNEDVVAAVVGARATLLVVADAHNGHTASEVAVDEVLGTMGTDPPAADLSDTDLVDLFDHVNTAVMETTSRLRQPRASSTTTLTMALIALPDGRGRRRLQFAAMGDSALIVARPGWGEELTEPRHQFVGRPMSRFEIAGRMQRSVAELREGDWVVLASDGFTNFVGPERAGAIVGELITHALDPPAVARALVERAGSEGAGDNVAVAAARGVGASVALGGNRQDAVA